MTTATRSRRTIPARHIRPNRKPARTPAQKPARRTIKIIAPGRVAIAFGDVTTTYAITALPAGDPYDGRTFRVSKDYGETCDVFLRRFGQSDSCTCEDFAAHGHCNHVDGLNALLELGKLDDCPTLVS